MSAFGIGWGIFWLLIWFYLLLLFASPPRKEDDTSYIAAALLGCAVSVAWIVAFVIARALS